MDEVGLIIIFNLIRSGFYVVLIKFGLSAVLGLLYLGLRLRDIVAASCLNDYFILLLQFPSAFRTYTPATYLLIY